MPSTMEVLKPRLDPLPVVVEPAFDGLKLLAAICVPGPAFAAAGAARFGLELIGDLAIRPDSAAALP